MTIGLFHEGSASVSHLPISKDLHNSLAGIDHDSSDIDSKCC
jgi:hypothetical protein